MADVGVAETPPVPEGAQQYQKLIDGGFSAQEADAWKNDQTSRLLGGGFSPQEIAAYWGEKEPSSAALDAHHKANLSQITSPEQAQKVADDPLEMLAAGWQMSVGGLSGRGRKPDVVLPKDAGFVDKMLAGTAETIGDFPWMVAGALGGAAAGAAIPGAGETGIPEMVGGGAGAAALPQAMREIMLDAYSRGEVHTLHDFMVMAGKSLINTGKAALAGAVAGGAGGTVGGKVLSATGSNVLGSGANAVTQAATYTTTSAALEGRVPDAEDFVTGSILALGLTAAGKVAEGRFAANEAGRRVQSNLQTIYKQTGIPPWEAVSKARTDPALRQEILAQDPAGEPVIPMLRREAPNEPEPYLKPPALHVPNEAHEIVNNEGLTPEQRVAAVGQKAEAEAAERAKALEQGGEEEAGSGVRLGQEMLPLVRSLEKSADDAVSPAGAIGRYQIMPGTARQYGFDPERLADPEYNRMVASHVLNDLWRRYNGDAAAVLVAYNAGPGVANKWLASGRDFEKLPLETQRYLAHAAQIGRGGGLPPASELVAEEGNGAASPGVGGGGNRGGGNGGGGGGHLPGGEENPRLEGPEEGVKYATEVLNDKINDMVGEPPQRESLLNPARNYRQWISELGPAREIDKMLVDQGFNKDRQLGLEDMFRQTYASDARVGYLVHRGGLDPITLKATDAPSVMKAVQQAREDGGNLNDWRNYMLTQRAVEKAAQGFETGHPLTPEQQAQVLKDGAPLYERATRTFNRAMDGVLEYGLRSGVFSEQQVAAMKHDNPTYISFRRILGDNATAPLKVKGKSFRVFEPVKRFEGDDRQIVDPMLATIDNMHQIVRMADRNRAIGAAIALAEKHGILQDLGLKRLSERTVGEIAEPGSDVFKPYKLSDLNPAETYKPFLAIRAQRGAFSPNRFTFIRDGKPEVWEAKDDALATLLRGADSPGEASLVTKVFQSVAAMQRAGLVSSPDFPARVTLRHQITAFVADANSPPPFVTWLRGAMHALKADDVYWDWVGKGGAGTALADLDVKYVQRDMDAIFEKTGTWDAMWNTVRHPLQAAQILAERIDAAGRIGYKMGAEAKGVEPIKAATMGRKAMLDYVEKGTLNFAQWWARSTPFMRPHFLGLKQFGEAITERPGATLAKAIMAVTIPQAVLYALNYFQDKYGGLPEDQKYENLPRYYRDGMYIFPQVMGVRMRLPLPFVVGVPFGGFTVRFLDHFVKQDPHAFENWGSALLAEIVPPFIPSLILPPLQAVTNHNFFTGQKLVPGSLENASGPMQYTENTTEPAKALAQLVHPLGADVSPIMIEDFVRNWSGTLGMDALKALNVPFHTTGRPWELTDIPFIQSFLIRNPGMSAEPIHEFYQARDQFKQAVADRSLALRRARMGAGGQEVEDYASASAIPTASIDRMAAAIRMQQAVLEAVNNDPKMTTAEKRQYADTLYSNMILVAKAGLQVMEQMAKAGQPQP